MKFIVASIHNSVYLITNNVYYFNIERILFLFQSIAMKTNF